MPIHINLHRSIQFFTPIEDNRDTTGNATLDLRSGVRSTATKWSVSTSAAAAACPYTIDAFPHPSVRGLLKTKVDYNQRVDPSIDK